MSLRKLNVSGAIIGATRATQIVDENIKVAGLKISAEFVDKAETFFGSNVNAV